MAKRVGTVFVFKKGVTRKKAAEALHKIKEVIDMDYLIDQGRVIVEFDDDMGGPVWYIP